MFFGLIVFVVGVIWLLQNLGLISGMVWSLVWPVLVIAAGVGLMMRGEETAEAGEDEGFDKRVRIG